MMGEKEEKQWERKEKTMGKRKKKSVGNKKENNRRKGIKTTGEKEEKLGEKE